MFPFLPFKLMMISTEKITDITYMRLSRKTMEETHMVNRACSGGHNHFSVYR